MNLNQRESLELIDALKKSKFTSSAQVIVAPNFTALSACSEALQGSGIAPPDDSLLATLLVKQFQDRQLRIGEEVIAYLVPRMERSFEAVSRIVAAIDAMALERLRPVTVPLARDVLDQMGGSAAS